MRRIVLALAAGLALVAVPAGIAKTSSTVKIRGGATTLALDPGTAKVLTEGLGLSVAPLKPASANAKGALVFPITTGRVNANTLAGSIWHSGGLKISKAHTVVRLRNFRIRITASPDLTARVGSRRIRLLALDLSHAAVTKSKKAVTVAGVKASLTNTAATALNQAFKTDALKGGTPVGTATVRAKLR